MFLSAHEIAESREHALNNLLELSAACIEAGQRLSELVSSTSHEAIHHGSKHWSLPGHGRLESVHQAPLATWLENSARASRVLNGTLEIIGETHKALIRSAEAQVRVVDEIVFASINRATKTSPWEAEIALNAMKVTLQSAEQTLHEISAAAIQTVDLAEHEVHQVAEEIVESRPTPRKRSAPRQKAA